MALDKHRSCSPLMISCYYLICQHQSVTISWSRSGSVFRIQDIKSDRIFQEKIYLNSNVGQSKYIYSDSCIVKTRLAIHRVLHMVKSFIFLVVEVKC